MISPNDEYALYIEIMSRLDYLEELINEWIKTKGGRMAKKGKGKGGRRTGY